MSSISLKSDPQDDDRTAMMVVSLTCTIIALVVLVLRVLVRLKILRNFGWDDAVMCLAMLFSVAGTGFVTASAYYGAGRHIGDIPPAMYTKGMEMNVISEPIIVVGVAVVKISVGLALLRIVGHTASRFFIIPVMAVMGAWAFCSFFTILFECSNPAMRWDSNVKGTCMPQHVVQGLGYMDATLNITTDILFAVVIPVPLFWNLNASLCTRLSVIGILGLGVFACTACIIKTVFLYNLGSNSDWLWDSRNITIWNVVELNTGIVAGSLPAIWPLFRRSLGGVGSSSSRGQLRSAYRKSSQPGNSTFASRRSVWFKISGVQRPGQDAVDETSSERALNATAGGGGQDDSGPGSYELGYMGNDGKIQSTSVVTSDINTSDDSVDGAGIAHRGIRKTATTTVTFEDTSKVN
ncbi:hypothetical protein VMCG_06495 [Cytospora schulzeri]|uniref:Rhodopsin domain-containing protein n=1 Tax=Cytospora schulzeri TaxID=448051 RepID=A0A423WBW7_9PEZI|nr:hypothetical protein VMCG_06495 [Valsa malicola]